MQTKVIIIGKNPSIILGQIRELGAFNYDLHLIKTSNNFSFEFKSKYLKSAIRLKDITLPICDYLIQTYGSLSTKNVILPADDSGTIIIDQNMKKLSPYFVFPNINNSEGEIERSMDKFLQKQIAIKSGFKTARGLKINVCNNNFVLPDNLFFPCFVKPCCFDDKRKSLMFKCNTIDDLKQKLSTIKYKQTLLVEENVNISKEWGVLGVNTNKGLIIAGLTEKHIVDQGVTVVGISHYLAPTDELYKKVQLFMNNIGYYGFFGLDMLETNGDLLFCEVNFRLPNFGVSYLKYGFHLAHYLVATLLGEPLTIKIPEFKTFTFADERVLYRKYIRNDITFLESLKQLREVDFTILKDSQDSGPYRHFCLEKILKIITYCVKKIIKIK